MSWPLQNYNYLYIVLYCIIFIFINYLKLINTYIKVFVREEYCSSNYKIIYIVLYCNSTLLLLLVLKYYIITSL